MIGRDEHKEKLYRIKYNSHFFFLKFLDFFGIFMKQKRITHKLYSLFRGEKFCLKKIVLRFFYAWINRFFFFFFRYNTCPFILFVFLNTQK